MPYTRTFKLKDNEIPAKIDLETGEITPVRNTFSVIPDDMEAWLAKDNFTKKFLILEEYLEKNLTSDEYKIVGIMSRMAHPKNNSLMPLDDTTSVRDLEKRFYINKNKINKILNKLFELGIFARFEVYKPDKPYTKYWILNPYISSKSRYISSDIASLFEGTVVEKEYQRLKRLNYN